MYSVLLVVLILLPALGGVIDSLWPRRLASVICSIAASLLLVLMWQSQSISISLPLVFPGLKLSYGITTIGLLLAAATTIVWLSASIFSLRYMHHEHNVPRFYLLFGLSVSGALACFTALDFAALLLGFELMSLASYGLVAHATAPKAQRAGRIYLYLGVAGGVLLSCALAILYTANHTLAFSELHGMPLSVTILLALGFAIKAGAFPLHFWLPEAHPVAPSPGSALLSGILIKTGAYGLLQVASLTSHGSAFGLVLIVVALVTMSLGVCLALLQHDAKRLLAYHSVSQMGYILLGVGLWAFDHNALGLGGAVLHIANHALFKSALFLVCGSALLSAGTVDLYELGFLRKASVLFIPLVLIPAAGIAGIPGFNGYISKTILHDALLHAHTHSLLLTIAEKVFVVVAFGTVCSFIKFTWYMLFAKRSINVKAAPVSSLEHLALGILALVVVIIGVFPAPVVHMLENIAHSVHGHWPEHLELFGPHALQSAALVLTGGTVLFLIGIYSGLFHLHLSERYSILFGVSAFASTANRLATGVSQFTTRVTVYIDAWIAVQLSTAQRYLQALDYKPSASPGYRALSVTNLTFDVYIVMGVLSILILMYPLIMR